jgi:hypothetical protein
LFTLQDSSPLAGAIFKYCSVSKISMDIDAGIHMEIIWFTLQEAPVSTGMKEGPASSFEVICFTLQHGALNITGPTSGNNISVMYASRSTPSLAVFRLFASRFNIQAPRDTIVR